MASANPRALSVQTAIPENIIQYTKWLILIYILSKVRACPDFSHSYNYRFQARRRKRENWKDGKRNSFTKKKEKKKLTC
jgi:hypothetical protein